jgi:DNA ligase 1
VALRFARVKRYRQDKSAEDADTIDDLRALLGQWTGGGPSEG